MPPIVAKDYHSLEDGGRINDSDVRVEVGVQPCLSRDERPFQKFKSATCHTLSPQQVVLWTRLGRPFRGYYWLLPWWFFHDPFWENGRGIYTKAADLVGKVERNIPEDDPRNPTVIADNVGDNVGDIAGIGLDLFGSYVESSCATLIVASISSFGINHEPIAMLYPLHISSMCIIVFLITTLFATDFIEIKVVKEIEPALRRQLIISITLMTLGIGLVSWIALPSTSQYSILVSRRVKNWDLFFFVAIGLWASLVIVFVTEYYTSNAYSPVQDVADSCRIGTTTNVIFRFALGYKSIIIIIFAIAISDKAGGIAGMAGMSNRIRERTAALDATRNTIAAIEKIFANGSVALVSLALFSAFMSRASISTIGDKLKLLFAHMNLEDKIHFEGAGSDRM